MAETETKKAKAERKIYKGVVKTVKELNLRGAVSVQPVERHFKGHGGFTQTMPPSFIITRFSPGYTAASRLMHYYDPKSGVKGAMDVPEKLELNVLLGTKGKELDELWATKVKTSLGSLARRVACTIGTDPEIFVVNDKGIVPAWKFLGSKKTPDEYTYDGLKGELYWDGFQAEFTTPGNLTCLMQMGTAVRAALHRLEALKPSGSRLSLASVLPVDPKILAKEEEEHVQFGCAPSKNLYGLRGNTQDGRMVAYRFAGGHIHMGLDASQKTKIPEIVRALDTVLGVACVSLFANYDNPVRRKFYGQAGEYRTPPHGLEYRVLSNAWLSHPVVMHMVFDLARGVAGLVDEGFDLASLWEAKEDETLQAIQDSNVEVARRILDRNRPMFTQILYIAGAHYGSSTGQDLAWDTWSKGMEHLVAKPEDIHANWRYNQPYQTFSALRGKKDI